MKPEPDDRMIADRLEALRQADEESAPSFEQVWDAAERRAGGRQWTWHPAPLVAIAACALVAIAALLLRIDGPPAPDRGSLSTEIAAWSSPTAPLLSTPRRAPRPALTASLAHAHRSVSHWHSPTDSLLGTFGGGRA